MKIVTGGWTTFVHPETSCCIHNVNLHYIHVTFCVDCVDRRGRNLIGSEDAYLCVDILSNIINEPILSKTVRMLASSSNQQHTHIRDATPLEQNIIHSSLKTALSAHAVDLRCVTQYLSNRQV